MKPQQALAQLRSIQAQLVRDEKVQCYRWATLAFSGLFGLIACWFQPAWVHLPHAGGSLDNLLSHNRLFGDAAESLIGPSSDSLASISLSGRQFFWFWTCVATINFMVVAAEMRWRYLQSSDYARKQTLEAALDFAPSLLVAASLSVLLVQQDSIHLAMLPGLWALFFSLGIFASRRRLPDNVGWVAIWYLVMGIIVLNFGQPLAAWKMAVTFGGGQLLMAMLLLQSQTKHHE